MPDPNIAEPMYLIVDTERRAYWGANCIGYTCEIKSAGRYPRREALTICANARHGWRAGDRLRDIPVLEIDALELERLTPASIERYRP